MSHSNTAETLIESTLDRAIRAAMAAGEVLLRDRQTPLQVDRSFAHDIKLAADRDAEAAILNLLRAEDPEASIHTEESGDFSGRSDHVWYIDPLDGTMNYYHGQHHYCTCVACYQSGPDFAGIGTPLSGVVFAPDDDELFHAEPGEGAFCNGRRLQCSGVTCLADAIIGTSFGSDETTMMRMNHLFSKLLPATRKLRILGSCGLDICQVAAGRLSALYQRDIRIWDFAAAALIVHEAGGHVEIHQAERPGHWHVLATAPGIHEDLHRLLQAEEPQNWISFNPRNH
ncbi:MAG: inositol monophosphatase family protein [Kiritimatiellia bacterium]